MTRFAIVVAAASLSLVRPSSTPACDFDKELAAVNDDIRQSPTRGELYFKRAELYRTHEHAAKALPDYEQAARYAPRLERLDLGRAAALLEAGDTARARAAIDRFMRTHRDDVEGLITRARVRAKAGQNAAAVEDYSRAIPRAEPANLDYYLERARAQAAMGDTHIDEALGGLDRAAQKFGRRVDVASLALDLEVKRKRYDAALERVDQLIGGFPPKERWLERKGEILEQSGRHAAAREAYGAALASLEAMPAQARRSPANLNFESRLRAALAQIPQASNERPPGPR